MGNFYETEWENPELDTLPSLAQHLVYRLNGCDDTTVRLSLQEVYRDFCRRSCCLRVRRLFDYEPDGNYFASPLFGGEVMRVTEVRAGGRVLREGKEYTSNGGMVHVSRFANVHTIPPPRPVMLSADDIPPPPFDKVAVAWIEVPSISSEKIPSWLIRKHGDTLCSGVLARLMALSNRPWSDPQMAAIESNRYEAALNEECQLLYAVGNSGNLGSVFDTRDLI